jgi:GTP-binding protein HflX
LEHSHYLCNLIPISLFTLIVSIIPDAISDIKAFKDLKELKELVDADEGKVVEFVTQKREIYERGQYIGKGKVEEVNNILESQHIDVIVLNGIVNPNNIFDMKTIWQKVNPQIEVWDRVDLILNIFSRHARTAGAKLQIELAAMRHMGPRIYGMGQVLSRQGGSIGTRGIGETNTELMKRHWREQIKSTKERLEKLVQEKERQIERRREKGLKTVSLIGYTNAGKTSLFNLLTRKKKLVQNALFVTLDSSIGKIYSKTLNREILISDTIGFINNLPTKLIDAFKSTLMESVHADLLLQIIDISDEDNKQKIEVVENILKELGIADKRRIFVFNKIDASNGINKIELIEKYAKYNPQFISVRDNLGIDSLLSSF